MNCDNCDRPKKSLITALSAFGLMSFCGVIPSTLMSNKVIRSSDETLRTSEADPALVCQQFAYCAHTATPKVINVIERAFAPTQIDQILNRRDKILVG